MDRKNTWNLIKQTLLKQNEEVDIGIKKEVNPIMKSRLKLVEEELLKYQHPQTGYEYSEKCRLSNIKFLLTHNSNIETWIKNRTLLLIMKSGIINPCSDHDPIGMICTPTDCLGCTNCDYKIILDDGETLLDYLYDEKTISKCEISESYTIVLKDKVTGNLFDYLLDDNSDYRIIRNSDGEIMRQAKEDKIISLCMIDSEKTYVKENL